MDAARFDSFARSLTDRRSRRGALAAALAGGLGLASLAETDAKKKCPPCKKRKQGKCKKKLPDGTTCTGGVCHRGQCCVPACSGKQCGDDGCGGSCGMCTAGAVCHTNAQCVIGS